jgi:hypothetical protein
MVSLITALIGIATAITIMILIRRDHLHVRYGLWWMAAASVFALLGLFPTLVDYVAGHLGIGYPPVLALILGLTVLVLKILVMDIERSRNAIKQQRLVQRVALLEAELRDLQRQQRKPGSDSGAEQAEGPDSAGEF